MSALRLRLMLTELVMFLSSPRLTPHVPPGCRVVLVFGLQGTGSGVIDSSSHKVMMADKQLQVHGSPDSPGDAGSNGGL
uniref:Uncharacterized protein n=1 Tax=Triticum urartu TaxID=4572 RepID=A0A8R7UGF3_TRIUA